MNVLSIFQSVYSNIFQCSPFHFSFSSPLGCTRTGEYLVSRSNRCQYVHCAYRSSPRGGSSVVGILRQCPPGTAVPRALYSGSQALRVNHPMAICSERVYTPWYAADCNGEGLLLFFCFVSPIGFHLLIHGQH